MPTDKESGWVEPDIIVNGRALTFAECMAVRVAVTSFRLSLTSASMRAGLGPLANNYDHHLASVERTMLTGSAPEPTAHRCYRRGCGKMTTLGTAWCQDCLDKADAEKKLHPPRPPLPRPKPGPHTFFKPRRGAA